MRARTVVPAFLLALAAAPACTAPRGGPQPARVVPAQVDGVLAAAIEIQGIGFEALVTTDFGDGSGAVDAGFTASLAPSGGGAAVPLAGVSFADKRTLRAIVPAGLPHALYDLVVADAAGRSGFLAGALRVATPAGALAAFRVAPLLAQRAGGSFTVAISAVDTGGSIVDGFEGTVILSDATGTLAPLRSSAFVAGELRMPVVVEALAAADVLQVVDAAGHGGASSPFAVGPGLPVAVTFGATPLSGAAGACLGPFTLEVLDRLGNATPTEAELRAALETDPPGAAQLFLDAGCTVQAGGELTVANGASSGALWLRAIAGGSLALRARPDGLPSALLEGTVSP